MARINTRAAAAQPKYTHEGAKAAQINVRQQLERLVLANLLWEDQFYVDGKTIAGQIEEAANKVSFEVLAQVMYDARNRFHLRHVPLLLADILTKRQPGQAGAVASILKRADEPGELIALHFERKGLLNVNKSHTLPSGIRKGIELALQHGRDFGEYGLAKYDRDSKVKLRDVFRLVHPKPLDQAQSELWKRAGAGTLPTPDTWEVALSRGADKKETFERMLREGTLGYLALLRNLRNMEQSGVDRDLIKEAILLRKGSARVLPFRYIAAARAAPSFEQWIDKAFIDAMSDQTKIKGKTALMVDVSGSMTGRISAKSDMDRIDAACALAAIARGSFADVRVYATAGSDGRRRHATAEVPAREGMAMVDAVKGKYRELGGGGIFLKQAMDWLRDKAGEFDRVIVFTDEQDCDLAHSPTLAKPPGKVNYMVNVASYKHGIGYGKDWIHIDGFSEALIKFIRENESYDSDPQF